MSTETVEELIVKLGLDPSQFTEGQRRVDASLQDLKGSFASSTEDMGASIASVIGKLSAFTLGFAGLAGAIDLVKNLAFEFKDLAIQAEALGTSVNTLRTLQEFDKLAGAPQGSTAKFGESGLSSIFSMIYGPATQLGQFGGLEMLGFQNPGAAIVEETQNPKRFYEQMIGLVRADLPNIEATAQGVFPGIKPVTAVTQTL